MKENILLLLFLLSIHLFIYSSYENNFMLEKNLAIFSKLLKILKFYTWCVFSTVSTCYFWKGANSFGGSSTAIESCVLQEIMALLKKM